MNATHCSNNLGLKELRKGCNLSDMPFIWADSNKEQYSHRSIDDKIPVKKIKIK